MTLEEEFEYYKSLHLSLNMARGKPCLKQLNLSNEMLGCLSSSSSFISSNSIDIRNYGALTGIEEAKTLMAEIAEVNKEDVIIWGNSSLNIMYNLISHAYTHGILGSTPWCKLDKIKFLCPVPGYDRHFAITEYFGIEMINIPMDEYGPNMDLVESLLISDESIKGIWCVPIYSNPTGITYSDEVVKRFAKLKPKAKDFRIYWDLAYCMHHHSDNHDNLLNLFDECKKLNNEILVYEFISTSKMTFPGSGISAVIASSDNLNEIENFMGYSTIGFDKVNMMRHVLFLKNRENIENHMKKHAEIIKPKFDYINKVFLKEIPSFASWSKPNGGYFISLNVNNCAKEVISRCKEAGLILTSAGSSFPYHKDPTNSNIRLAPTYVSMEELKVVCKILCLAIKIESNKKHIE